MLLKLELWEDGEQVQKTLKHLDRWAVQAAHRVTVVCAGLSLILHQQPQGLSSRRVGVGACSWDGAFVLTAFLLGQRRSHPPKHCVELGAGVGLVGIALAKLGGQVVLTDKDVVLPLLEQNIACNSLESNAFVQALEWGQPGYLDQARALARTPVDLVVAADCLYIDQDGSSPSIEHFVAACAALSCETTQCYVAFETRSDAVRKAFLHFAQAAFQTVELQALDLVAEGFRADHIEVYRLAGTQMGVATS